MHISDAIIPGTTEGIAVLASGAAIAAVGTAIGLRKMDYEQVPQVGLLSAAFFVVSLISVPIGGVGIHLVLNGLMGLLLGWAAFPAVLVALLLQAAFCGHGGLTTLGLNTTTMALPAVVCYYLYHGTVRSKYHTLAVSGAFTAGATAILLGAAFTVTALLVAGGGFQVFSRAVLLSHLALAGAEGLVTASVVSFLRKVQPELLEAPILEPVLENSEGSSHV
jgi:cobalt/nickel transport system permease protein